MRENMDKKQIHWEILAAMVLFIGTVLGIVIPLHMQTNSQIMAIQQEMKDFHGRLCSIEERNKCKP